MTLDRRRFLGAAGAAALHLGGTGVNRLFAAAPERNRTRSRPESPDPASGGHPLRQRLPEEGHRRGSRPGAPHGPDDEGGQRLHRGLRGNREPPRLHVHRNADRPGDRLGAPALPDLDRNGPPGARRLAERLLDAAGGELLPVLGVRPQALERPPGRRTAVRRQLADHEQGVPRRTAAVGEGTGRRQHRTRTRPHREDAAGARGTGSRTRRRGGPTSRPRPEPHWWTARFPSATVSVSRSRSICSGISARSSSRSRCWPSTTPTPTPASGTTTPTTSSTAATSPPPTS